MLQPAGAGQSYPLLQFATVAGSPDATVANYTANGGQHATTNANPTLWGNSTNASTLPGMLLAAASDNTAAPIMFECDVAVERPATAQVFSADTRSASFHSSAGMQHMFWYMYWTGGGAALRVAELTVVNGTANNWLAGSFIEVEWS
jgi:hypothetical protein